MKHLIRISFIFPGIKGQQILKAGKKDKRRQEVLHNYVLQRQVT